MPKAILTKTYDGFGGKCDGYGRRFWATVLGDGFGRRCLATVLGNDDAYVSNFSLTVHPGGYGGSPPIWKPWTATHRIVIIPESMAYVSIYIRTYDASSTSFSQYHITEQASYATLSTYIVHISWLRVNTIMYYVCGRSKRITFRIHDAMVLYIVNSIDTGSMIWPC